MLTYRGIDIFPDIASATVISYLEKTIVGNRVVAYFYFDYLRGIEQTAISVLSNLLKQLLCALGQNDWPEGVSTKLQAMSLDRGSILNVRDLIELVFLAVEQFSSTFFVFDALDECEDPTVRWKLLTFIQTAERKPGIKIFISRRHQLSGKDSFGVTLPIRAHNEDIEAYVREKLECKQLPNELQREVIARVVDKADGMSVPLPLF